MGKFGNSQIHDKYSDWHWNLVNADPKYKRLYVADVDRLWIEYDFNRNAIIAVMDIKWDKSGDGLTATEKGIYEWFESKGVKCFIVFISRDFKQFTIIDFSDRNKKVFDSTGYADWLLDLRKMGTAT